MKNLKTKNPPSKITYYLVCENKCEVVELYCNLDIGQYVLKEHTYYEVLEDYGKLKVCFSKKFKENNHDNTKLHRQK